MDEPDYVETSDAEELEIIQETRSGPLAAFSLSTTPPTTPTPQIPRKRRKISHDNNDSNKQVVVYLDRATSLNIDDGSTTPSPSSPGLPTSTAVSEGERLDPTDIQSIKKFDLIAKMEDGDNNLDIFSSAALAAIDITYDARDAVSQDELDVISLSLSQADITHEECSTTSRSPRLEIQRLLPSNDERPTHKVVNTSVQETPDLQPGPGSLPPSRHASMSYDATNGRDFTSDLILPHNPREPTVNPPRFSSLPPSSPPRTTSSVTNTPQRSVPNSPEHAAFIQPPSPGRQNTGINQSPPGYIESAFHFAEDGHDDMAPRRYSLRARQARQLNPYEYDKRLYKQQMRRLPDAIVKVVSPQRHHSGRAHRRQEMQEEDDFIVSDEEDESQEAKRRIANGHRSSDALHQDNEGQEKSLAWLSRAFYLSDDDELAPLSPLAANESRTRSVSEDLRGRHNSRHSKLHRFPLEEARIRHDNHPERDIGGMGDKGRDQTRTAITYARRKETRSRGGDRGVSSVAKDPNYVEQPGLQGPFPLSPLQTFPHDTFQEATMERDDGYALDGLHSGADNDEHASVSYDEALRMDTQSFSSTHPGSDTDSDSENEIDSEMSRRDKKRLKQLGRMYPAFMIPKLAKGGNVPSTRRQRSRSKSATVSIASGSENDEESLIPGRSRITRRPGTPLVGHQIKGDSESSESEAGAGPIKTYDENVVEVESSSESDPSDTSESDDDALTKSFADTGYFDHDFSRRPTRRREEPLFDMMLCRTRTKGSSLRKKQRKRKTGAFSRVENQGLRANGLDVSISKSHQRPRSYQGNARSKQTRLRFDSAASPNPQSRFDDMADITNLDWPFTDHGDSGIGREDDSDSHPRLTKKQRREAAQKATLYTITGHDKKIGSGRKKGFMTVQIDMADDGLRDAIRPLSSDIPLQRRPSFNRTASGSNHSTLKRTPHDRKHLADGKTSLKQTSLHDFSNNDYHDLDPLEPSSPRHGTNQFATAADMHNEHRFRNCSIEMGISAPGSLAFGAASYLGKQLLPELLKFALDDDVLTPPESYTGFGLINLDAQMSRECFVEVVEVLCNLLSEWLDEESCQSTDEDNIRRYEHAMYSVCRFAAWILEGAKDEERRSILTACSSCAARLTEKLQKKTETPFPGLQLDPRCLTVMWFNVELTIRLQAVARRKGSQFDVSNWRGCVTLLIKSLMRYGVEKALQPIQVHDMSSLSPSLRAAELWVCLIHLLPRVGCLQVADDVNIFWSVVLQVVKDDVVPSMADIEISEHLWTLVFGLCALSHFSAHGIATPEPRLPPCWDIIGLALDTIRLKHDKAENTIYHRENLKKRDKYVRMVVARCLILGTKWRWPLRDANTMFKKLVDIFRTRNFGNLLGEHSEFPEFLQHHDLRFQDELRHRDTAFSLYLKLVMQATKPEPDLPSIDARTKPRITKLLSLVVPLSGVAFSKTRPPMKDELSMLINRFSAVVVAILVDGRENANIQNRITQARRFVDFVDADERSRQECIRAAMYLTIALNHLSLETKEPLMWLGEMCQTLLDDFQNSAAGAQKEADVRKVDESQQLRRPIVVNLNNILECVTNIIERPTLSMDDSTPLYPNVDLIGGPWVKQIFPTKELTTMVGTRVHMLQLVQSFLKARAKVIPPPRRPALAATTEDNSESQDMFGEFEIDDAFLADFPMDGDADETWKKDREVADIMNCDVVPNMFRLLLQYFNDPLRTSDESRLEEYWGNADDWIDCWVGCAAIVVRNEIRTWDHYLSVGPQSWGGIGDSFFRRSVAVRFMYQLLKWDPTAYNKDHERNFLAVFLQSLVAYRITMENEYLSMLFSVDGLRHPLLREIPMNSIAGREEFHLTRVEFLQLREEIISRVFSNLDSILVSDSSERDKNVLVECVVEMLSAMTDIWNNHAPSENRDAYGGLCRHVFSNIRKHARVHSLQRLSTYLAWGASFDNINAAA